MKKAVPFLASAFVFGLIACSDGHKTAGGVSIEENTIADGNELPTDVLPESSSSVVQGVSSALETPGDIVIVDPGNANVDPSGPGTPQPSTDDPKSISIWDGSAGEYKVNTDSEDAGYWYTWADDYDGGTSTIVLPVEKGNEYSGDVYEPVIDHCGGFCGTVVFGTSIPEPVAGVGFNVATEGETADISAWGGLCVTYSSELAFDVVLASETSPRVEMPISADTTRCVNWRDFVAENSTAEDAAKKALAIRFVFKGGAGESGDFNIKAISTYTR